ncbi:hypothetical protein P3875_09865 [Myroides sp. JBRI-B21084]|uniref:hypothetical protein n=1 Tax=Myroides sp. JBRI-B21084 TaxID=3119977 RepID=UPI0026E45F23|nr:hypothetical protein [Paenimyroides cloacae]WKW46082.1 hypothetical protein P3875_09865 [Paenimyroides cloacae]
MKKWLIIGVTFIQLCSTTQFSQLYKLPLFFSHYLEYSHNSINFEQLKSFIVHHYGGHEIDDDWQTDKKLPFMSADRTHLDFCYISNFKFSVKQNSTPLYTRISGILCRNQILISSYLNSIWQPPKIA